MINSNKLNILLRKWADQVPSAKNQIDTSLTEKVMDRIRQERIPREFVFNPFRQKSFLVRFALGVFIILLVINVFFSKQQSGIQGKFVTDHLALKPEELEEIRLVSSTIEQLFPEGLLLIRQSDGKMDIKAGSSNAADNVLTKNKILIVLQLVQIDRRGFRVIHRQDLIVRDGEPIRLNNGEKLSLWTCQADENHISIELDSLIEDRKIRVRVRDQFLQSFGEQTLIAKTRLREGNYEVYQTAYRL